MFPEPGTIAQPCPGRALYCHGGSARTGGHKPVPEGLTGTCQVLATHALPWTPAVHQGPLGDAGTLLEWSLLEASHCQPAATAVHREPLLTTVVCSFLSPRGAG